MQTQQKQLCGSVAAIKQGTDLRPHSPVPLCVSRTCLRSGWRTVLLEVPLPVPPSRPAERTARTHRQRHTPQTHQTHPTHIPLVPRAPCSTSTGPVTKPTTSDRFLFVFTSESKEIKCHLKLILNSLETFFDSSFLHLTIFGQENVVILE